MKDLNQLANTMHGRYKLYIQILLFWLQRSIANFVFIARNHTCMISTYYVDFFIATKLCLSFCTWRIRKAFICKIWPWFIKICIIPLCYISIMVSYFQEGEKKNVDYNNIYSIFKFINGIYNCMSKFWMKYFSLYEPSGMIQLIYLDKQLEREKNPSVKGNCKVHISKEITNNPSCQSQNNPTGRWNK